MPYELPNGGDAGFARVKDTGLKQIRCHLDCPPTGNCEL